MFCVKEIFSYEIEIKKSKFLTYISPIEISDNLHNDLKQKHPKAVHIVWAKRFLNEYSQIVENSSDDGEPKGTSGPPVLNAMRGANLINSAIFVVRYFGGIKLGTGGLVRAYGSSANGVIETSNLVKYERYSKLGFSCPYTLVQKVEYFLNKQGINKIQRSFEASEVIWELDVNKSEGSAFLEFANLHKMQGLILLYIPIDSKYNF